MWQTDVVNFLRDCKDCGWPFEDAWEQAVRRYPPRGTGMGRDRFQSTLFDDDTPERTPTVLEFFRVACDDAWHGRRPRLAYLTVDLLEPEEHFETQRMAHA